jgi:uncharacterized membrane protein YeaQ/YmgE (transglycosylase-associated protein family)
MVEHIVQMGPMLALGGLMAGWMAEAVSPPRGYGFIPGMTLGIIGSLAAGATVWLLVPGVAGMATTFLIGSAGAALAILSQRRFWPSARLGA